MCFRKNNMEGPRTPTGLDLFPTALHPVVNAMQGLDALASDIHTLASLSF